MMQCGSRKLVLSLDKCHRNFKRRGLKIVHALHRETRTEHSIEDHIETVHICMYVCIICTFTFFTIIYALFAGQNRITCQKQTTLKYRANRTIHI